MFSIWLKSTIVFIFGLTVHDTIKTRKEIRKGNVQWVAWKGKYDSVYVKRQEQLKASQK